MEIQFGRKNYVVESDFAVKVDLLDPLEFVSCGKATTIFYRFLDLFMSEILTVHGGRYDKRGEHVVQENLKCVREGLKSVMEIPWSIISAPAQAKAKASEEVVFAK